MNKTQITTLGLLISGSFAGGQIVVNWGAGSIGATFTEQDTGATIAPGDVTFELGIFHNPTNPTANFSPSLANAADWRENWQTLDQYVPNQGTTFDQDELFIGPTTGEGANPMNIQTGDGTPFPLGSQLYIWAYRDGVDDYDPTSGIIPEWALLTNDNVLGPGDSAELVSTGNWIVPASSGDAVMSHESNEINLFVSTSDQPTGVGGGDPNGNLTLQPIPEPSSIMMTLLAAGFVMRRKR